MSFDLKGVKRIYDPDKHCGAIAKQTGEPCTQFKGWRTNHKGTGRCRLHGGIVNMEAAKRPKKNGIYCASLVSTSREAYEEIAKDSLPLGDLNEQIAYTIHAKIIGDLRQTGREPFNLADRKMLQACDALIAIEDPHVTPEYKEYLRAKLTELSHFQLASLAGDLARISSAINVNTTKQLELCKKMIVTLLNIRNKEVTGEILSTLRQMVIDCGLDIKAHDRILAEANVTPTEEIAEELEA